MAYNDSKLARATGVTDPMTSPLTVDRSGKTSLQRPAAPVVGALSLAAAAPSRQSQLDPALSRSLSRSATDTAGVMAAQPVPSATTNTGPGVVGNGGDHLRSWQQQQLDALAPQLRQTVEQMPGALSAASAAGLKSFDEQERLTRERINALQQPQGSDVWGRLGASLLKPTTTGTWGEAWGNAATAAMDQRAEERRDRQVRDEKLFSASLALARLGADRPNAVVQGLKDQLGMAETVNSVGGYLSDNDLIDARRFPDKYLGARGQAMVADARARLSTASDRQWELDKMDRQSQLKIAEETAKRRGGGALADLSPSEEKMVSAAHGNVLANQDNLALLRRADELDQDGKVMGGYAPRFFADTGKMLGDYVGQGWVPDALFGSPEQQDATQSYYQVMDPASLERIKQNLPGVMTDRDLQFALGVYADPNATAEARKQARETIRNRFTAQDKVSRAQLQRLLGPEGAADLLGEGASGSEGEGDGGNARYLTPDQGNTLKQAIQHAQQNKAYGGVAKRLNEMGFTITPDQLRQLTPDQVDKLIKSAQ